MNFIEAVKKLENDCYLHMYIEGEFHKRVHLVNDELQYVEQQLYYDGTEKEYVPTAKYMLKEDWIVTSDDMVDGIRLNDLKGKTIKNFEYSRCHFIVTLCDGKQYKISGDGEGEGGDAVTISEITGN